MSSTAPPDIEHYERLAESWWSDPNSPLAIIRYTMNPIRFAYVIKHLVALSFDFRGARVLDIGCGGGFLTEEIAKFGLDTTAVDPSPGSLHAARKHADAMNLVVDYREGVGEALDFPNDHFDMVFCLDVLEHVRDFRPVVAEVSRVLAPGGLFFFETINRTILSYFIVIFLMQNFRFTQVIPPNVHQWGRFIKPRELRTELRRNVLEVEDMQGILPGYSFVYNLPLLHKLLAQKISFHDLCRLFRCHESVCKDLCYVGYARKKERHLYWIPETTARYVLDTAIPV